MPDDKNKKNKAETAGQNGIDGLTSEAGNAAVHAGQRAITEHIQKSRDVKSIEQSLGKIAESGDPRALENLPSWLQEDLKNSKKVENAETIHDLAKSVVSGQGVNYSHGASKVFAEAAERAGSRVRTEDENVSTKISSDEDSHGTKVETQREDSAKVSPQTEDSTKVISQEPSPAPVPSAGQNFTSPALNQSGASLGSSVQQGSLQPSAGQIQQAVQHAKAGSARVPSAGQNFIDPASAGNQTMQPEQAAVLFATGKARRDGEVAGTSKIRIEDASSLSSKVRNDDQNSLSAKVRNEDQNGLPSKVSAEQSGLSDKVSAGQKESSKIHVEGQADATAKNPNMANRPSWLKSHDDASSQQISSKVQLTDGAPKAGKVGTEAEASARDSKLHKESDNAAGSKAFVKNDAPDGMKVHTGTDGVTADKTFITDASGRKVSVSEFMYGRHDLTEDQKKRLVQILGKNSPYYIGGTAGMDVRQDFFRNREKTILFLKENGIDVTKLSKQELNRLVRDGKIRTSFGKIVSVPKGTDAHAVLTEFVRLDEQKTVFQNMSVKEIKAVIKGKGDSLGPKVKNAEQRVGKVKGEAKGSLYNGKAEEKGDTFISGKVRTGKEVLEGKEKGDKVGSVAGKKNVSDKVKVNGKDKDVKVSSKVNVKKKNQEDLGKKPKDRPRGIKGLAKGALNRLGRKGLQSAKDNENSTYMEKAMTNAVDSVLKARQAVRSAKTATDLIKAIFNLIVKLLGGLISFIIAALPVILIMLFVVLIIVLFVVFFDNGGDGTGEAGPGAEAYRTAYNNIQASMINLFEANKYKAPDDSGTIKASDGTESGDTSSTGEAIYNAKIYTKLLQQSWYNQMKDGDNVALHDALTMISRGSSDTDKGFNLSRYWGPDDVTYTAYVDVWDDDDDEYHRKKMTVHAIAGLSGDLGTYDDLNVYCYGADSAEYKKSDAYKAMYGKTNPDLTFANNDKPYIWRGCGSTTTWSSTRNTNYTTSKSKTLAYDGTKVKGENRLMRAITVMSKFYVEDPEDKLFTTYMLRLADMSLDSAKIKLKSDAAKSDSSKTVEWEYKDPDTGHVTHCSVNGYSRKINLSCEMDNIGILDLMRMDQYGVKGSNGNYTYSPNNNSYAHANSDKTYVSDSIKWDGWFDASGKLTKAAKDAIEIYESFEENDVGADNTWDLVFGSTIGLEYGSGTGDGGKVMANPVSTSRISSIIEEVRAQGASEKTVQIIRRGLQEVGRHPYGVGGHYDNRNQYEPLLNAYGKAMDCSGFINCLMVTYGKSPAGGAVNYASYGSTVSWNHNFSSLKPGDLIVKNKTSGTVVNGKVKSDNHVVMYIGKVDIGDGNGVRDVCVECTTTTDAFGKKCSGISLSSPKRMNYIKSYGYARRP